MVAQGWPRQVSESTSKYGWDIGTPQPTRWPNGARLPLRWPGAAQAHLGFGGHRVGDACRLRQPDPATTSRLRLNSR
jgi:hypothetical protein